MLPRISLPLIRAASTSFRLASNAPRDASAFTVVPLLVRFRDQCRTVRNNRMPFITRALRICSPSYLRFALRMRSMARLSTQVSIDYATVASTVR